MIKRPSFLRRFRREDSGSLTIEFAIMFPLFITAMMGTVELGMITLKQTMLERALDLTVREIRLGTGKIPQHDDIKKKICDRAEMLDNCSKNLRLEMIRLNMRAWVAPRTDIDCVENPEVVKPARTFENGNVNELMLLRACVLFKPIIPSTGLGKALQKNNGGFAAMVAQSAFVQEPK